MSTAIQKAPENKLTLKTERAAEMRLVLQEEKEVRALVREFIAEQMVVDVDYGPMPGVKPREGEKVKNVLFKPGAEKLLDIFRCKPVYKVLAKTVDPASGLYYYELRCRAVNRETGVVINEGLGSASSYESRYRYRNADRLCPACKKPTIIKGKAEYGGGWICFGKKGGCGAKWPDGAKEIEGQDVGKIQNPDLADVANTVLKIAKKRAQVDCAIGLARVSDLFTADLEDLPTIEVEAAPRAVNEHHEPRTEVHATDPSPEQRQAAQNLVDAAAALGGTVESSTKMVDARLLWSRLTKAYPVPGMRAAWIEKHAGRKAEKFSDYAQPELAKLAAALEAEQTIP